MTTQRVAVLDDYQDVAFGCADWSGLEDDCDITVFNTHLGNDDQVVSALSDFEIICAMRERTLFSRTVLERLPNLKLLVTTGMLNASIDMAAADDRGITVCGTYGTAHATAELTWALILGLLRHIPIEHDNVRSGGWQTTLGIDLKGKTLGLLGLGRLGSQVARVGAAFGMEIMAWSENLSDEHAQSHGARRVEKEDLFRLADILSIHTRLSDRTQGLVGRKELALMKPSAYLINTSRGPIVDEAALVEALNAGTIAGAGLDVYGIEPMPTGHPLRTCSNLLTTPHIGYVTEETYEIFYRDTVEDIRAFLDGEPVRVIKPK